MCLAIVFQPVCGVINFERNFIFLMKPFFKHDQKLNTKSEIPSEQKKALNMK